jgi:hypothetical protein
MEWIVRKEGFRICLLLVLHHWNGNDGGDDFCNIGLKLKYKHKAYNIFISVNKK